MQFIKNISGCLLFCCSCLSGFAQKTVQLSSPDGQIVFSLRVLPSAPVYRIAYRNQVLINDSPLGLTFLNSNTFRENLQLHTPVFRQTTENYELIVGKRKKVSESFKEVVLPLEEPVKPFRKINLVVRAFNDGLAFRYEIPGQKNWPSCSLTDEQSTFKFVDDPTVLTLFLPNYTTSHEGLYSSLPLSEVKEDTLMDMPTLFQLPHHTYVAITEAALIDYAGMYLSKHQGILTSKLSPLPNQRVSSGIKVKATLPHHSPWRVLLISSRMGALIESTIITSLNEPCKIKDASWIKPGKTTFPWWNGNIVPDTSFVPGNNFETNKYYIDFCSRNGLEYHSVVEYGGHEWYVSDGLFYAPGPHTDVTKPVPGLDMQRVCDYGKQKGVGIRVWVHWKALYAKLEEALTLFEKWGIKGMMVDFMDRDDQEMVNIQERILQRAAAHHMHVQFHGAYKPTGLSRTYPNEFTREGTLNYEANKWNKIVDPNQDINIPFTRMLAGPTDYHLGGFRAVPDSLFKVQYTRPLMLGTRCHMLAMYVVLENYQGMVCDYPAAYEGQPGFAFIQQVPTVWDETKVLDAAPGEYITIARKKNNDWFLGSITNNKARQITISFSFLPGGEYEATIYTDAGDDNKDPNHLNRQTLLVNQKTDLPVQLAAGGGAAIHIRKIK
jgi:alpha-glucosidase